MMAKIEDTRRLYFEETVTIHKSISMKLLPTEYHHLSLEELKKLYNEDDSRLKSVICEINIGIDDETPLREKITFISGENNDGN